MHSIPRNPNIVHADDLAYQAAAHLNADYIHSRAAPRTIFDQPPIIIEAEQPIKLSRTQPYPYKNYDTVRADVLEHNALEELSAGEIQRLLSAQRALSDGNISLAELTLGRQLTPTEISLRRILGPQDVHEFAVMGAKEKAHARSAADTQTLTNAQHALSAGNVSLAERILGRKLTRNEEATHTIEVNFHRRHQRAHIIPPPAPVAAPQLVQVPYYAGVKASHLSESELLGLSKARLQEMASERGLATSGTKAVLESNC